MSQKIVAPWSLFILASCGGATIGQMVPIDLSQPWVMATPDSQHVDASLLARANARAQSSVGPKSLLVVRNGFLISEQYFADATAEGLSDVRSVTKSVMSLLLGIAIARGEISGTSEKLDALIRPPVASIEGASSQVTVENLLTMTSGFWWDESTAAGYNEWVSAPDQVQFLLDRPLSDFPGARFNYNSAAVHLLSVGLTQATGGSTLAFADQTLFAPLSITSRAWEVDHRGFQNGGSGLSLRPRDLAKIGQLVLQGGKSGDHPVVPSEWIRRMVATQRRPRWQYGPLSGMDYGYLWWLASVRGHAMAFGWGYRGQYLFVVQDLRLVVVLTSALDAPIPPDEEGQAVLSLFVNDVIPAVRD